MSDTPDQTPPAANAPDRAPATKSHGRLSVRASLTPRDLMEEPLQVKSAWRAKIITLMPDAFPGILGQSLTGKALDLGLWALDILNLRPYGLGKHLNVDDTPSGGGAGMVLRADVLDAALTDAAAGTPQDRLRWPLIYLSPRGKPFTQAMARRFAACDGLTLLCGRFEGVDQRLLDHHQIEEVSLGDFVLTGGEIPAMALIDATVRLLPKVLGNEQSTVEESFSDGLLEHPHYTRPAEWQGRTIPEVLTSGNHAAIAKWRQSQAEEITKLRRPDLWQAHLRAKS
ncbi:MAG: tRNA (guanosine(37)-N1)-methyltransferase TrmD [Cypionkella sp.]